MQCIECRRARTNNGLSLVRARNGDHPPDIMLSRDVHRHLLTKAEFDASNLFLFVKEVALILRTIYPSQTQNSISLFFTSLPVTKADSPV